jgi:hypothetical protein
VSLTETVLFVAKIVRVGVCARRAAVKTLSIEVIYWGKGNVWNNRKLARVSCRVVDVAIVARGTAILPGAGLAPELTSS